MRDLLTGVVPLAALVDLRYLGVSLFAGLVGLRVLAIRSDDAIMSAVSLACE